VHPVLLDAVVVPGPDNIDSGSFMLYKIALNVIMLSQINLSHIWTLFGILVFITAAILVLRMAGLYDGDLGDMAEGFSMYSNEESDNLISNKPIPSFYSNLLTHQ